MTKSYDVDPASVSWVDPTGQTEYTLNWGNHKDLWLNGVNLNDGTEWTSPDAVEEPERFGPTETIEQFFAWAARFVESTR